MAQEHGDEMPIDKLSDSKQIRMNGIQNWKNMVLTRKKRQYWNLSYVLCIAQEQFMELVQLPELGGFSLTWEDNFVSQLRRRTQNIIKH